MKWHCWKNSRVITSVCRMSQLNLQSNFQCFLIAVWMDTLIAQGLCKQYRLTAQLFFILVLDKLPKFFVIFIDAPKGTAASCDPLWPVTKNWLTIDNTITLLSNHLVDYYSGHIWWIPNSVKSHYIKAVYFIPLGSWGVIVT